MRRALINIVPDEVLNRKRKAYVARAPLAAISAEWAHFTEMTQHMMSSSLGIVEAKELLEALEKARHGQDVQMVILTRTLGVERWLQKLSDFKLLNGTASTRSDRSPGKEQTALPHEGWKVQPN